MRPVLLILLFAVSGFAVNAQFSIQPQAGLENTFSKIRYNGLPDEISLPSQLTPRLGLKLDYKMKQGHGAFIGLATSRTIVAYDFTNPETGMSAFTTSNGKLQLRFEGGYQFNTKRLFLNKQSMSSKDVPVLNQTNTKKGCGSYAAKSRCGKEEQTSTARSRCGSKETYLAKAKPENKGWFVRIQPALGLAFVPSNEPDIMTTTKAGQTIYTYNASNIRTALIMGTGFEFGNKSRSRFVVNINYLKGLSGDESVLTTQSNSKTTITRISSKVGGWNASIGIPISLTKTKAVKQQAQEKRKTDCQYRIQQYKIQYKSRCQRAA